MAARLHRVNTFPSVSLPSHCGGLPVEVSLIAQLGAGGGDALVQSAQQRQRGHAQFVDAMDEPSVRIGAMDLSHGDSSALYTFAVGASGHPFHRHAGRRVFTAISGSGGALLRFSTASDAQLQTQPSAFVQALRHVQIPPDCLFTVRFGGDTWHQFLPLRGDLKHPALFALSCHPDELGGELPEALRQKVATNAGDIPSLTQTLPADILALLEALPAASVPTFSLSLEAAPGATLSRLCGAMRAGIGSLRGGWAKAKRARGFLSTTAVDRAVRALPDPPHDSMLRQFLLDGQGHQDTFELRLRPDGIATRSAEQMLAAVLEGFLARRPVGVTWLMALRNVLVAPLRLRTSPLGCPVSSLLATDATQRFAGRFPVLDQCSDPAGQRAQVLLGADDRHLRFRSCVGVQRLPDGDWAITLGTRVHCVNAFGRLYMAVINRVHQRYVSPALLRLAVEHAVDSLAAPAAALSPQVCRA